MHRQTRDGRCAARGHGAAGRPGRRDTGCRLLRLAAGVAAILCAGGAAQAQLTGFSSFEWTFGGDPSGWATVTEDTMHIVGPAWDECTTSDTTASLTTVAPADGIVAAHVIFDNQDGGFGFWAVEDPTYLINGEEFFIGGPDFFSLWEGDVSFAVQAGDSFGFGVHSSDCSWGPGVLDVVGFTFTSDEWLDLGHGLFGVAGMPLLVGLGPLQAGEPWTLSLIQAAPSAPAWLLVGFTAWNAPFKGGVIVPQPALPLLLSTSPLGRIVLTGTWPSGIPAGTPLLMQYWIQDGFATQGWSASNAVSKSTS